MQKWGLGVVVWLLGLVSPIFSLAQPTTSFWFEGYVYGTDTDQVSQRAQFVPVVLALANSPTKYLAVTMTDGAGFYSFRGTPIDYKQKYLVTLLYGTKNETYQCLSFDVTPSIIGAISSDIKTKIRKDFYTETSLAVSKQKQGTLFSTFLKKQASLQLKGNVYSLKGKKGMLSLFVNGKSYTPSNFQTLLQNLTTDQVESATIIKLKNANKYTPGAIAITLKDGAWVSLNTSHNFVPLPKK